MVEKQKTYHKCDSCGGKGTIRVKDRDSFYNYLCSKCYREWLREKDTSGWDEEY